MQILTFHARGQQIFGFGGGVDCVALRRFEKRSEFVVARFFGNDAFGVGDVLGIQIARLKRVEEQRNQVVCRIENAGFASYLGVLLRRRFATIKRSS